MYISCKIDYTSDKLLIVQMTDISDTIVINGSIGEGGGQMIRYATILSAITRKSVHIINIRANRPKGGGLGVQHLHGVNAMAKLADLVLVGNIIKSTDLLIKPNNDNPCYQSNVVIYTKTAASITLISQMLIPWMMYHPCTVEIKGGTTVPFSPPIEYLESVFIPVLRSIGVKINVKILKHGTYPKGGGHVILSSETSHLTPLILQVSDEYPTSTCKISLSYMKDSFRGLY